MAGPAPAEALAGRDAVVHLAGEHVAQRWNDDAKQAHPRLARDRHAQPGRGPARAPSRARACSSPPRRVGYYGQHGDERVDEDTPPGDDFLAEVCVVWEREAHAARASSGARRARSAPASCSTRTAARWRRCCRRSSSASAARSPAATSTCRGSTSTTSSASTSPRSTATTGSGPVNASAPEPVTNAAFSKALGRALHRPAVAPVPGFALRAALRRDGRDRHRGPARGARRAPQALGYAFAHPDLDEALRDALS